MEAPAIRANRGDQTPQAMTTYSQAILPLSVTTASIRPRFVSMSRTSVTG